MDGYIFVGFTLEGHIFNICSKFTLNLLNIHTVRVQFGKMFMVKDASICVFERHACEEPERK